MFFPFWKVSAMKTFLRDSSHDYPKLDKKFREFYKTLVKVEQSQQSLLVSVRLHYTLESGFEDTFDERIDHYKREGNFEKINKMFESFYSKLKDDNSQFDSPNPRLYLVNNNENCLECGTRLSIIRPSRGGKEAVYYTRNGIRSIEAMRKQCLNKDCGTIFSPSYYEIPGQDENCRVYSPGSVNFNSFFAATAETFFETALLREMVEDLYTLDARFHTIVEKYNRLHPTPLSGRALSYKRILDALIIYKTGKPFKHLEF